MKKPTTKQKSPKPSYTHNLQQWENVRQERAVAINLASINCVYRRDFRQKKEAGNLLMRRASATRLAYFFVLKDFIRETKLFWEEKASKPTGLPKIF